MSLPIMQFGTSRFLQAHVDLFVSEALAEGKAAGKIALVQTTNSPESSQRVDAFNTHPSFPVLIRGLDNGVPVERRVEVSSIGKALQARRDWLDVMRLFTAETRYVVSNTGDRGYVPDPDDRVDQEVPNGFPAKLVKLLHARWRAGGDPVTFLPCELTSRNGDVLRDAVLKIAQEWETEAEFQQWIGQECVWANSLVDRIVSEPLQPIGAVAEPYALWAIEDRASLTSFCRHRDIRIVPDLRPYEWLKLFILNLGHTFLAERWLTQSRPRGETVREALQDPDTLAALTALYEREVLPIFAGIGMGDEAVAYKNTVMDRFANPFLDHRVSDIAANHAEKKTRRIGGLLDLARARKVDHPTPVLDACLNSSS